MISINLESRGTTALLPVHERFVGCDLVAVTVDGSLRKFIDAGAASRVQ